VASCELRSPRLEARSRQIETTIMTKLDFSAINKSTAKSFNEQRNLIKKIGKGETVLCATCRLPLTLSVSSQGEPGVSCEKGCTCIALELEA